MLPLHQTPDSTISAEQSPYRLTNRGQAALPNVPLVACQYERSKMPVPVKYQHLRYGCDSACLDSTVWPQTNIADDERNRASQPATARTSAA
jgi:hypothetical protein